jgi:hypothetical protein
MKQADNRMSGLKDKTDIKKKKKKKNSKAKDSSTAKGTCKNLATPSKEQTCKSWALEKGTKPKRYTIY